LKIWEYQDILRGKSIPDAELALQVLDLNDMRFRVKNRINYSCNSSLKEQKGYANKVGIFIGHMGLGDLLNLNGAIRYASLDVDKLYVLCLDRNYTNIKAMFEDDPTIVLINIGVTDCKTVQFFKSCTLYNNEPITKKYISGDWLKSRQYYSLPNEFYADLNFPIEIKHTFSKFNFTEQLVIPNVPYFFVHTTSSTTQNCKIPITWDINTILTIDPGRNLYSHDHIWFEEAQRFVDKPFFGYKDVIEHATEIHVSDSSFYCLSCFLRLKAVVKKVYQRNTGQELTQYNFS
jgi:hypothetical protein